MQKDLCITPCFSIQKSKREIKQFLLITMMHAIRDNKCGQFNLLPSGASLGSRLSSWWKFSLFILGFSRLSSFDIEKLSWALGPRYILAALSHALVASSFVSKVPSHAHIFWMGFVISASCFPFGFFLTPLYRTSICYSRCLHSCNVVFSLCHLKILNEFYLKIQKEYFVYRETQ